MTPEIVKKVDQVMIADHPRNTVASLLPFMLFYGGLSNSVPGLLGASSKSKTFGSSQTKEYSPKDWALIRKESPIPRRNELCPCGSQIKFKNCCMERFELLNTAFKGLMRNTPLGIKLAIQKMFNLDNIGLIILHGDRLTKNYQPATKLGVYILGAKPENIKDTDAFKIKYSNISLDIQWITDITNIDLNQLIWI